MELYEEVSSVRLCKLRLSLPLFVFMIVGPKQNAGSLLTPVSDTVFYALSHCSHGLSLLGSCLNHSLIGENAPTANLIL